MLVSALNFTPSAGAEAHICTVAAPLFDAEGNLRFFIGGQINCSTTIRSNTDVLKILSMSDDPEDDKESAQSIRDTKPKRSFFGFTRKDSSAELPKSTRRVEVRGDGMEQGLLKHIEKMNFRTQMEIFYTAYSKVSPSLSVFLEEVLTTCSTWSSSTTHSLFSITPLASSMF